MSGLGPPQFPKTVSGAFFGDPLVARVASAAGLNATLIKASAAVVNSIWVFNTATGARYFKFYDKGAPPTVGTDIPLFTVPIAAGSVSPVPIDGAGVPFYNGLAYAITGGVADTDTTPINANDVHGFLVYS
jgi:hypothetical protein